MVKKSTEDVIAHIKAKYDVREAASDFHFGKTSEPYGKFGKREVSLAEADRAYQNAHKDRITLPKVKWLRRTPG